MLLWLSEYFNRMSQAVHAHKGTIDKYIGDSVMALWNAPVADADHVANACRAALACRAASRTLGVDGNGTPLRTRIGLNDHSETSIGQQRFLLAPAHLATNRSTCGATQHRGTGAVMSVVDIFTQQAARHCTDHAANDSISDICVIPGRVGLNRLDVRDAAVFPKRLRT